MAQVEHSTLTSADLHEPKGVATADVNTVYMADGGGSGSWQTMYINGWEDVNDSGSSQGLDTAYTDLTNDAAGPNTDDTFILPGRSTMWDTSNNELDFASGGLKVGDLVSIRMDFDITTAASNSSVVTAMDFSHGDASEFEIVFERKTFKNSGTFNMTVLADFYVGDETVLDNPAKIKMKSDNASDSVVVKGWLIRTMPINPVFA